MSDKVIDWPMDNIDERVRRSIASNSPRATKRRIVVFEEEMDNDLLRIDSNEHGSSFPSRQSVPFRENSKSDRSMSIPRRQTLRLPLQERSVRNIYHTEVRKCYERKLRETWD